VRVSQTEKAEIKEKILVETLTSLKMWGQSAAPVDKIMKRLGLTSGALYSHFKSKDDLIAQVILRELDRMTQFHLKQCAQHGCETVSRFIEYYMSDKHISEVERGCMFVAMGADLHRLKPAVREKIEEKLEAMFLTLSDGLPHKNKSERLKKVKFIFSTMLGTLVLARTMKSDQAKANILSATKQQLLNISKME
jgi:TetR/AcrR family transcriptional regulator, transcriptional repressor for nem operon